MKISFCKFHYYFKVQTSLNINYTKDKFSFLKGSDRVTILGRPAMRPLVACIAAGLNALGFPAATIARSLRCPSNNSLVRLCVIDEAELIVSCLCLPKQKVILEHDNVNYNTKSKELPPHPTF